MLARTLLHALLLVACLAGCREVPERTASAAPLARPTVVEPSKPAPVDSVEAWLAAMPFDLVGAAAADAARIPGTTVEGDVITWTGPGLAAASGYTLYSAVVANGRVIRVRAQAGAPRAAFDAIRARLTVRFEAPPEVDEDRGGVDEYGAAYHWNRRPRVELDGTFYEAVEGYERDPMISLSIGEP
jgi:hypothetical protein